LTCQYRKVTGRTMTYEDAVANIPALDLLLWRAAKCCKCPC
jgi:hypothetical protein